MVRVHKASASTVPLERSMPYLYGAIVGDSRMCHGVEGAVAGELGRLLAGTRYRWAGQLRYRQGG